MGIPLRLLLIEDSETDAMLLLHQLKKGGYDTAYERVETAEAMKDALDRGGWDVIVSDLILPRFSGLGALEVHGRKGLDIPFIMVSGKAGEETAVTAMKAGAQDYILKDNMARLLPAIERELKEAEGRRERRRAEEQLDVASALLEAAQAILGSRDFREAARPIFNSCKRLVGAGDGCMTILGKDGTEAEVLYQDQDGMFCMAARPSPMYARDLRAEVYQTGYAVYDNACARGGQGQPGQAGCGEPDNVLLAPLAVEGETVGLLELSNKPGGFNDEDATIVMTFGEMAAIAYNRSRTLDSLEISERRFRSVAETANDAVIVIDAACRIVFWNQGAERIFGYTSAEVTGRDLELIMPARYREQHRFCVSAAATVGRRRIIGRTVELHGLRKDGSEFPIELSLAAWETAEGAFFTGIVRDITERKDLELQRADFYAMVTHDIKSPLSSIIGLADLILETKREKADPEILKMTEQILKSGLRLDGLVEGFLTHARLESGTARLHKKPVDMAALVNEVRKDFARRAEEAGLTLKLEAPEHLPPVHADRGYILRAIENLVGNAVAYTPRGGEVTIKAEEEVSGGDACITISVSDTGPGITPEEQAKVFNKYYRSASAGGVRGSGLGLAIVKAVADAHGASVFLESSPGAGSTFRFCMPVKGRD